MAFDGFFLFLLANPKILISSFFRCAQGLSFMHMVVWYGSMGIPTQPYPVRSLVSQPDAELWTQKTTKSNADFSVDLSICLAMQGGSRPSIRTKNCHDMSSVGPRGFFSFSAFFSSFFIQAGGKNDNNGHRSSARSAGSHISRSGGRADFKNMKSKRRCLEMIIFRAITPISRGHIVLLYT